MEADYIDTYVATVQNACKMTARDLFRLMFVYYPKLVLYLLRLRDWLVKPFGLQGGGGFTDLVRKEDDERFVLGKSDKHLDFNVILQCDAPDAQKRCQTIRITTIVRFHNLLGKGYFFFIRPFHALICKGLLTRAAQKWEKMHTYANSNFENIVL